MGATAVRCIERRDEFVLRVEWTEVAKHLAFGSPLTLIALESLAEYLEALVGFAHYNAL